METYDYDDISRVWVLSLNESKIYQLPTSIAWMDVICGGCLQNLTGMLELLKGTDLITGTPCERSTGLSCY